MCPLRAVLRAARAFNEPRFNVARKSSAIGSRDRRDPRRAPGARNTRGGVNEVEGTSERGRDEREGRMENERQEERLMRPKPIEVFRHARITV